MLKLPSATSELRETFDVESLAYGENIVTLAEARASARKTFANVPGVRRVYFTVIRANGDLHLISFGPRGGWKVEWRFGPCPGPGMFSSRAA